MMDPGSASGEWSEKQLCFYYRLVDKTILRFQDPVSGLLRSDPKSDHAWIRDNVYAISGVWALSLAYKKDPDASKAISRLLAKSCVKCMRGLFTSMMRQRDKVERFKRSSSKSDSIHAKFSVTTGLPVVGDNEWGHLQIDAISLFLLTLAQMTSSGLHLIYTLDEVAFVQNLVFYIESAYCTPDFGIWERGDKSNTGIVELNSSSIGMALAAMEALDELDLFGVEGGSDSKIHVMMDESQQCKAVLFSMLPRESLSKETDSALLSITGYPAFAVENVDKILQTNEVIHNKLERDHGCIRFLRDGYKTPIEDSNRLHYWEWELHLFENIECEWPLFFCYMLVNHCFRSEEEEAKRYAAALENVIVYEDGIPLVPELYSLPKDKVDMRRNGQELDEDGNEVTLELAGRVPMMWAQSIYLIGRLLLEKLLAHGELDPVNRRLSSDNRPETIVQVVLLAENRNLQQLLNEEEISAKMVSETAPVEVLPASVLSHFLTYLGRNEKLGLSGRPSKSVGILATSSLYTLQGKLLAFAPQKFDFSKNYLDNDIFLMVSTLEDSLAYLSKCWSASGRPTLTLVVRENMLEGGKLAKPILLALRKLKNGLIDTTRVILGEFQEFLATACVKQLDFLNQTAEDDTPGAVLRDIARFLEGGLFQSPVSSRFINVRRMSTKGGDFQHGVMMRKKSVRGLMRRTRTIHTSGDNQDSIQRKKSSENEASSECWQKAFRKEESSTQEDEVNYNFYSEEEKKRLLENSPYAGCDIKELVEKLTAAENLEEQTDILDFLVIQYGISEKIFIPAEEETLELRDLVRSVYDTACAKKQWDIVRHCAGQLNLTFDDLSKAVTDLLVLQKQVTVGVPPNEIILSGSWLKSRDLSIIICGAYKYDFSLAMLTQEILLYLAMFIQTNLTLFHGMLRLRVGLIIDVMVAEMDRSLKLNETKGIKDNVDPIEELMSLSPYAMKNLLYNLMDGREFSILCEDSVYSVVSEEDLALTKKMMEKVKGSGMTLGEHLHGSLDDDQGGCDRQGSWIRRRRVDGALNRVPVGFYSKIWNILEKGSRLIFQDGKVLEPSLTQSMTSGEMKFALKVEGVLNTIPEPEYRQMLVEVISVLTMISEHETLPHLDDSIHLDDIITEANKIFLKEQEATGRHSCHDFSENNGATSNNPCGKIRGICNYFYDSAPSGNYGTLPFIIRACYNVLNNIPKEGDLECALQ